ncbi:2-oxoglutarate/malate transporter [Nocardia wallacei]|uniref:2-oxoglutarate/malate transporter n=1 Tax=Nocardia wallacei TaxID=480035 RepID=UPI0024544276|nr:2-oxoglutarate/malate transporter [Nocardia wallacei]
MSFTDLAGWGGIGFVVLAVVVNAFYVRGRLPMPMSGQSPDAVVESFAAVGDALKRPSVFAPLTWVCTTVFAAGLLAQLWRGGTGVEAWALVGFAGVLMQNVTFAVVEALRFAMSAAARHDRGSTVALWALSNVLFGFNQLFLAVALLGFSAAGAGAGFIPDWQVWLGYASAALLFVSSSASPYNVDGTNRIAVAGLVGWLGWAAWIVAYGIALLGA